MYSLGHLLSHLCRSQTDLVLDVGANSGQFAVKLFHAGFTGQVISFEPLSSAHAALSAAAENNPNWEVAPRCAIGATLGCAVINIAGNSFSSSLRPMLERHLAAAPESAYVGTETVPIETLGSVIARRFPGGAPRFALKIDTQGYEREVLDGLGAHIEQCAAVLLEMPLGSLYRGAADLPTLFTRLVKCNFRCAGLSPGHRNPQTRDAIEVDGLFVRDALPQPRIFPLLTSVPPQLSGHALDWQRETIASWRSAGFKPISVNSPSEIARLATLNLDIEIEPTSEDGKPFIGDILAAIKKSGCSRAGIINADCKVLGYPDLALTLVPALDNSVLYAERVDVGDGRPPTLGECNGFDAFFFDVGVLSTIEDRHFRLGETWWDYWFPLQVAAAGAMLGNIDVPLIYHPRHQAHWNAEQWVRHARHVCEALRAWSVQDKLTSLLLSLDGIEQLESLDIPDLSRVGAACFEWLRTRKLPHQMTFMPDGMESIEALLQDAYRSFSSGVDLAIEKAELTAAKAELAIVKASTSWRITEPVRQFMRLLRYARTSRFSTKFQIF
jgi:FkbM family methyltransferase